MTEPEKLCEVCQRRDNWGMAFCIVGVLTVVVLVLRLLWWVTQHLRWV